MPIRAEIPAHPGYILKSVLHPRGGIQNCRCPGWHGCSQVGACYFEIIIQIACLMGLKKIGACLMGLTKIGKRILLAPCLLVTYSNALLVIRNESAGKKVGKKLSQTWSPAKFARALSAAKSRSWSSSCSQLAVVPQGSWIMEHSPDEFKTPENPIGVGPYFGVTCDDGLDCMNKLLVHWCDKKTMKIPIVLSWLCPPVTKKTPVRVKDPDSGKVVQLHIVEYTKRGVKLLVQDVENVANNVEKTTAAAVKKRKSSATEKSAVKKKQRVRKKQSVRKKHAAEEAKQIAAKPARRSPRRSKPASPKIAGDEETVDEDDETPEEFEDADIRWKRFYRAPLKPEQFSLLVENVDLREQDSPLDKNQWHCFVDRVAREYLYLHARNHKQDHMHLHRETVLTSATAAVIAQIKPCSVRPCRRDVPEMLKCLQPIIEIVLNLCGPKAVEKSNTSAWIADLIKSGDYGFRDCSEHPELMEDYVAKKIIECNAEGSATGALVLKPGEEPIGPDQCYTLSSNRVGRRRATASAVIVV